MLSPRRHGFAVMAALAALFLTSTLPSAAATRAFRASDALHIQFAGALVVPSDTRVIDLDGASTSTARVSHLHAMGKLVVCYISAGTVEKYRADAKKFPPEVVGKPLPDWPDEKWLDVRRLDVLLPIMRARVAACRAKGFDAMDYDNVDAFTNDSGFPLTASDQVTYDKALAALAHEAGMRAVLKNALDLIPALVGSFDAALNEQCVQYQECQTYAPFVRVHKPVWVLEYSTRLATACAVAARYGLHVQLKHLSLDAWRRTCQ